MSAQEDAESRSPLWPCLYALSCGCEAELTDSLRWRVLRRCDDHPSGAVPVYSMMLVHRGPSPPRPP